MLVIKTLTAKISMSQQRSDAKFPVELNHSRSFRVCGRRANYRVFIHVLINNWFALTTRYEHCSCVRSHICTLTVQSTKEIKLDNIHVYVLSEFLRSILIWLIKWWSRIAERCRLYIVKGSWYRGMYLEMKSRSAIIIRRCVHWKPARPSRKHIVHMQT